MILLTVLQLRGAIPEQIRRLDDKLMSHNRIAVDITSGPIEKRTALYPIEAVQQITRNAIMHRTYEGTNAPVHVYWYNDRIEVSSPGGAFGTVTATNFGTPGFCRLSQPKSGGGDENSWLCAAFWGWYNYSKKTPARSGTSGTRM